MIGVSIIVANCFYCLQLQEFEGKDTAQQVDRYKFMNLYPCTADELK